VIDPLTVKPGIAQVVVSGGVLYISGQVAMEDGALVGEGDAWAQAHFVIAKIRELVTQAGGDGARIVKLTCYLAGFDHFPAYQAAKVAAFQCEPPACTTVCVELRDPRWLLEIDAIASVGAR
jgi:enamine deaminase RidA (YjgF/YER057c/UK114 family)